MYTRLLFFIGCYLFACITAVAQIATYQLSLQDSTQDILYVNYPNKVVVKNLPVFSRLMFDNNLIVPNNGNYLLMPKEPAVNKIYIYDSADQEIFTKEFTVSYCGDYLFQLGIVKSEFTSVAEVLKNPSLIFPSNGCQLKSYFRIVSYDIKLYVNGIKGVNKLKTVKTVKAYDLINIPFDKSIQSEIALMNNGDVIILDVIKVVGPDNKVRSLRPLRFEIAFNPKIHEGMTQPAGN